MEVIFRSKGLADGQVGAKVPGRPPGTAAPSRRAFPVSSMDVRAVGTRRSEADAGWPVRRTRPSPACPLSGPSPGAVVLEAALAFAAGPQIPVGRGGKVGCVLPRDKARRAELLGHICQIHEHLQLAEAGRRAGFQESVAQVVAVEVLLVIAGASELRPGLRSVELDAVVLQQGLGECQDPVVDRHRLISVLANGK